MAVNIENINPANNSDVIGLKVTISVTVDKDCTHRLREDRRGMRGVIMRPAIQCIGDEIQTNTTHSCQESIHTTHEITDFKSDENELIESKFTGSFDNEEERAKNLEISHDEPHHEASEIANNVSPSTRTSNINNKDQLVPSPVRDNLTNRGDGGSTEVTKSLFEFKILTHHGKTERERILNEFINVSKILREYHASESADLHYGAKPVPYDEEIIALTSEIRDILTDIKDEDVRDTLLEKFELMVETTAQDTDELKSTVFEELSHQLESFRNLRDLAVLSKNQDR
jgi:hypothetical protein